MDHSTFELLVDVDRGCTASLAFLVVEFFLNIEEEVALIWSKPSSAWIKWAYLFGRYFPIIAQVYGRTVSSRILYGAAPSISATKIWFALQVIVAHLTMMCGEIVMMARVYALYDRSRTVFWSFLSLLVAENVLIIVSAIRSFPGDNFTLLDMLTDLPDSFTYFGISVCVMQTVILVMSVLKASRLNLLKIPMVILVIRDGSLTFVALTLTSILLTIFNILNLPSAVPCYVHFLSFISAAECRLILNLLNLGEQYANDTTLTTDGIQLTSLHPDALHDTSGAASYVDSDEHV